MDVILLERVPNLGGIGDTVTVKPGFARNYLLPREKALRATDANRKVFEAQRADIEKRNAEARDKAENLSSSIAGKTFTTIQTASDRGALFGSVTARDVAELASTKKLKLDKGQVLLGQPIKQIGLYDVSVRLHPEVTVEIKVNVARTTEEAERQARGEDVLAPKREQVERVTGTGDFDGEGRAPEGDEVRTEGGAQNGEGGNVPPGEAA
jgi:large subunit ribosomal protein L9